MNEFYRSVSAYIFISQIRHPGFEISRLDLFDCYYGSFPYYFFQVSKEFFSLAGRYMMYYVTYYYKVNCSPILI